MRTRSAEVKREKHYRLRGGSQRDLSKVLSVHKV